MAKLRQLLGYVPELSAQNWAIVLLVLLVVLAGAVAIYQWRRRNAVEKGGGAKPASPTEEEAEKPSLIAGFRSRGRLRKAYLKFVQEQSAPYRQAMESFVPTIVMGPAQSGKSRLIDRFSDWKRLAKQQPASSTANPELSLYLGNHTVIQELSASLLEDTSAETRDALEALWKPLVRENTPIAVLVMDARMLREGRREALKGFAELMRGKLNLLGTLNKKPVEVRLALTHLDALSGFDEFARFADSRDISVELRFDRAEDVQGVDSSSGTLARRLSKFADLLPSILVEREPTTYITTLRFLQTWPELAEPLSNLLEVLLEEEPVHDPPLLSTTTFSSYDCGTANPLLLEDEDLTPEVDTRRTYAIQAGLAFAITALLLLSGFSYEVGRWYETGRLLDNLNQIAGARTSTEREEEDQERDEVIDFVLMRDGWRRFLPHFVPDSALAERKDELVRHIRQHALYPALCDPGSYDADRFGQVGEDDTEEGREVDELARGSNCNWQPTFESLYLVTVLRSTRGGARADVLEDHPVPYQVREQDIDAELIVDYLRINDDLPILAAASSPAEGHEPSQSADYDPEEWSRFFEDLSVRFDAVRRDRGGSDEDIRRRARLYWNLLNGPAMPDPNYAGQLMVALSHEEEEGSGEDSREREALLSRFRENSSLHLAEWLVPERHPGQYTHVRAILGELGGGPYVEESERFVLLSDLNRRLGRALQNQRRRNGSGVEEASRSAASAGGREGGEAEGEGVAQRAEEQSSGESAGGESAEGSSEERDDGGGPQSLDPAQLQQLARELKRVGRCLEDPGACNRSTALVEEDEGTFEIYQVWLPVPRPANERWTGRSLATFQPRDIKGFAGISNAEGLIRRYLTANTTRPGTRIFFDRAHPATTITMDYRSDVVFAGYAELDGRFTRAAYQSRVQEVVDECLRILADLDAEEGIEQELRDFVSRSLGNYGRDYVSAVRPYYRAFSVEADGSVETLRVALRLMSAAGSAFDEHLRTVVQNTRFHATPGNAEVYAPFIERLSTFEPLFALIDEAGQPTELLATYMTLMAAMLEALDAAPEASAEEGEEPGLADLLSGVGRLTLAELRREPGNYYDQIRGWASGTGLVHADQRLFFDVVHSQFAIGQWEIEAAVDAQWEEIEPRYEALAALYPFYRDSEEDASPSAIDDLLEPGSGDMARFVSGYLAPVSLRRNGRYRQRSCPLGTLSLRGGIYNRSNRAVATTAALYEEGAEGGAAAIPVTLEVRPVVLVRAEESEPTATLGYLRLTQRESDVTVYAFNQQSQETALSMDWRNRSLARIGLQITDPESGENERPPPVEVRSNFFSLLHLLEKADVEGTEYQWVLREDGQSHIIRFEIEGDPWHAFSYLRVRGQGG